MFSITIKGKRNPNDIELVKLVMVFYKTGYNRVPKVLYLTGAYSDYVTHMVSSTLKKVCTELGIPHHITWSTARSSFICKMLDEGYHVYQVAEMTGNSPAAIYKNYYGITNRNRLKNHIDKFL